MPASAASAAAARRALSRTGSSRATPRYSSSNTVTWSGRTPSATVAMLRVWMVVAPLLSRGAPDDGGGDEAGWRVRAMRTTTDTSMSPAAADLTVRRFPTLVARSKSPVRGRGPLSARMCFSVCRRYAPTPTVGSVRVLVVEDELYLAEAIRDGLRLEAIAADIAGDGDV